MQMAGDFVKRSTVGFKSLNDEENEDTFAKLAIGIIIGNCKELDFQNRKS